MSRRCLVALVFASASTATWARAQAPEPDPSSLTSAELEHRMFGAERGKRVRAADEALKRGCVSEETWLRFLDTSFATVEECEEAKWLASRALIRSGTSRSFPRIMALLREPPPTVLVEADGVLRPRYGYQAEASVGYHLFGIRVSHERFEAELGRLPPPQQAKAYMDMLVDPVAAWPDKRPPGAFEEEPWWWRRLLAGRLGRVGVPALDELMSRQHELTDKALREELGDFGRALFWDAFKAFLMERNPSYWDRSKSGLTDDQARELFAAASREAIAPPVRAALVRHARASLQGRGRTPGFGLSYVTSAWLAELEPEVMAFAESCAREDPLRRTAIDIVASFGTDRGMAWMVQHQFDVSGFAPFPGLDNSKYVPLCVSALESEQETPWSDRYSWFARRYASVERSPYADVGRLERVLARGEEILRTLDPTTPDRTRARDGPFGRRLPVTQYDVAKENLSSLRFGIQDVRHAQAAAPNGGGR